MRIKLVNYEKAKMNELISQAAGKINMLGKDIPTLKVSCTDDGFLNGIWNIRAEWEMWNGTDFMNFSVIKSGGGMQNGKKMANIAFDTRCGIARGAKELGIYMKVLAIVLDASKDIEDELM